MSAGGGIISSASKTVSSFGWSPPRSPQFTHKVSYFFIPAVFGDAPSITFLGEERAPTALLVLRTVALTPDNIGFPIVIGILRALWLGASDNALSELQRRESANREILR
jgi:hypothetical protein